MTAGPSGAIVRPVVASDFAQWLPLWDGYNAFYGRAGLSAPEEDRPTYVVGLNVPNRIEIIADRLLRGGYSAGVTEKVVGGNFVRVFTEIWG